MRAAIGTALALAAAAAPGTALAQASVCGLPDSVARPRADLPSAGQPVRRVPIGSYTLALTWSPEYCRTRSRDRAAAFQCSSGNEFGFTLHGLWPDGTGKAWPQYCNATAVLPTALVRRHMCATPSAQLLQHEWAKHGTCMAGYSPDRYFARAAAMYRGLRFPDMDALLRAPLTVGEFRRRVAAASRIDPRAIRVTTTRGGWLDELWLCTDKSFRYAACGANQDGGAAAGARLKIWRGRR